MAWNIALESMDLFLWLGVRPWNPWICFYGLEYGLGIHGFVSMAWQMALESMYL